MMLPDHSLGLKKERTYSMAVGFRNLLYRTILLHDSLTCHFVFWVFAFFFVCFLHVLP